MRETTQPLASKKSEFKSNISRKILEFSVKFWFIIAAIGQLIFFCYIIALYGGSTIAGNLEGWNTFMAHGYQKGHTSSNFTVFIHIFLAAIITLGGPLQIIPQIREKFRSFHRWNGRIYVLTAVIISITGIMINILNEPLGSRVDSNLTAFNGLLIIFFTFFVWKSALGKDFISHRKWALRLFLAVSGVWFFRVGLMFWILVNGGPKGFDPVSFTGPALTIINASQFIVPLAILEYYFRVKTRGSKLAVNILIALMILAIIITGIGVFGATMVMWLPHF